MKGEGTSLYTLRSQSWYKLVDDHGQLVTNQLTCSGGRLDALQSITLLKAKFDLNWQMIIRQLVTNQVVCNTPTVAEWMIYKLTLMPCTCEMKVIIISIVSAKILILRRYTLYMENGMLSLKLCISTKILISPGMYIVHVK